jgi:single-strand DNA-binding protein
MGRLTADPELRVATSGKEICRFRIAVERSGGERVADFIPVICFGSTAQFVEKYFRKGSMIAVQGKLQTGSYTDRDGNKRSSFEVKADEVSFCGEKKGDAQPAPKVQSADEGTGYYSNATAEDFEEITDDEDLPF